MADDKSPKSGGTPGSSARNQGYGQIIPAPDELPAFPSATRKKSKTPMFPGKLRRRWKDPDGTIYEWDSKSGKVEKFTRRGYHLGEFDHVTGIQTKAADPSRRVEP